jgi:hypothetical protein
MAKERSGKKSSGKRRGRAERGGASESAAGEERARERRESGEPGGGQGRRDEIGRSGVYPLGAENIPPGAEIRWGGEWGGGDYDEAGGSELVYRDGVLLGGTTAGPDGEPTIDIHGGRQPEAPEEGASDERTEAEDRQALLLRGLPAPHEDDRKDDRSGS